MGKRVSLANIARSTGFNVSTVSKALRNQGTFPVATREKIQEAARKLGYHPHPLLASLASKHFGPEDGNGVPLAYIHADVANPWENSYPEMIIKGAREHGRRLGYRLELFHVDDFKDGKAATRILFSRGVQGILLPRQFQPSMLPGMDWNRFSVVGWGESLPTFPDFVQPALSRATIDHSALVLDAWDEVWKRGYRRIGFGLLNRSMPARVDQLRLGAIHICAQRVPARFRIPFFGPDQGYGGPPPDPRELAAWIRRYRPDAVIGFSYFLWALRDQGFLIPKEIGFASLDKAMNSEILRTTDDGDAGMKDMRMECLLAAVELLDHQIRHHQFGLPRESRTITVNSQWIDGKTLPDKTRSK